MSKKRAMKLALLLFTLFTCQFVVGVFKATTQVKPRVYKVEQLSDTVALSTSSGTFDIKKGMPLSRVFRLIGEPNKTLFLPRGGNDYIYYFKGGEVELTVGSVAVTSTFLLWSYTKEFVSSFRVRRSPLEAEGKNRK
jgi:hypothetical protein